MDRAVIRIMVAVLSWACLWPAVALAQPPKAGVVTTIHGSATVARVALPGERALKFRDDLFLRDRITTQEESIVRALLGGKALVTIRELSVVTITEEVGRATVNMESGKIALAVARRLLRPGETLEIRTPNAIAAVRGTVVIVETLQPTARPPVTNLHVLKGVIEVLLRGIPGATPLTVGAGFSLSVTGNLLGQVRPSPPLAQIVQGLESPPQHGETPEEVKQEVSVKQQEQATALATALAPEPVAEAKPGAPSTTAESPEETDQEVTVEEPEQPAPFAPKPPGAEATPSATTETGSQTDTPIISTTGEDLEEQVEGTKPVESFTFSGTINLTETETLVTHESDTDLSGTPAAIFFDNANVTQSGAGTLIEALPGVTLTAKSPLVSADNSTITGGGNLLRLSSTTFTGPGPLVDLKDTDLTLGGAVGKFLNGSSVTLTSGPLFRINGGSLTADALAIADSTGNTFKLTGTLLDLTNTTVSLRIIGDEIPDLDLDIVAFALAANEPMFKLDNSTLTLTGTDALVFLEPDEIGASFAGLALVATNSTIILETDELLEMDGTFTTTSTGALVQLTDSDLSAKADALFDIDVPPPPQQTKIALAGPLLEASGTTLSARKAVTIDPALLEASAPLLILKAGSTLTTSIDAVDIHQATVTSVGPLVKLDASTLNVNAGPLVFLDGGLLNVTDDLFQLSNGSTVDIAKGAVLEVFGGGAVNVSGALIAFGGSGGNQIKVANNLCPCVDFGGVPVALTGGATVENVSVTNPIKNPSLGSISLSSSDLEAGTAVIVVNGPSSTVTISGQ